MNKDCIKIDDMQFTEMHTNSLHGTVKARLRGSSDACKMSLTLPLSPTVREVLEFHKDNELEVYIVRKGSNMANLGMAIIKASFDQGFTGADKYESMATEVREMIGTRILTKVVEPEYIVDLDNCTVKMRIDGVEVCSAKNVHIFENPTKREIFELERVTADGRISPVNNCDTAFFKTRMFGKRTYNKIRTRAANTEQMIEYITKKYDYETYKNK